MSLLPEQISILRGFVKKSNFMSGAVILDMDGTTLVEEHGKVFISGSVEKGVRAVTELGRPVIMNSLRFPLSVIRRIAEEWLKMSAPEIPVVLLNGSLTGFIKEQNGKIIFSESGAYPLERKKIKEVIEGIRELVEGKEHKPLNKIDLFYYPRDWKKGEIIWIPTLARYDETKKKYQSACEIIAVPVDELERRLLAEDICMMMLLVDMPHDQRMAYQHHNPSDFFTKAGVSKSFGTRELARKMNISLLDSVSGGDTSMDDFLETTGLAVIVGEDNNLKYRGRKETMWVDSPSELGELLISLCEMVRDSKKHEN
jgi:hydroxymethylpyrimidine pyrophosphatase-like HAD family hydrolase